MADSATSKTSADHDAVFLECMKKLRLEKENWESAYRTSNTAAQSTAEENIAAYAAGASANVPSFVPNQTQVKENLSATSNVFAKEGQNMEKRAILNQIMPALRFCRNVKLASGLAAGGGLIALGCLAEHHTWWMTDGSLSEVTQIVHGDHATTLAWDSNDNGILDMQKTIDPSTGIDIVPPHAITDEDTWGDIGDFLTEVGTRILDILL